MEVLPHHLKNQVCQTRPKYREGKVPKTVKVQLTVTSLLI